MAKYLSDAGSSMPFKKPSSKTISAAESADEKKRKKKEKSLRRFIPAIFTKDSANRKVSSADKSLELGERKRRGADDRYYSHHYQQNTRMNRCSDPLYLRNDGKMHVNSNPSLSGSMIEERLNEIKHDLFPGGGATTPDHYLMQENSQQQQQQQYNPDNCCGDENRYAMDGGNVISGSPNIRTLNIHGENHHRQCELKRNYSFQDPAGSPFRRNCGPSGRISAPPSERFLIRPRAIHPVDRPLPAIPQKVAFGDHNGGVRYVKYPQEAWKDNKQQLENNNAMRNASPCSSLKSADEYADSSYTANSSQKSEFSPTSSKSGEYYLTNESPQASNQTSSNESLTDQPDCTRTSVDVEINNEEDHLYDKTPSVNNMDVSRDSEPQEDLYEPKSIQPIYDEAEQAKLDNNQDELYDIPPPPSHEDDNNDTLKEEVSVSDDKSIDDNYQQQEQQQQQQKSNDTSPARSNNRDESVNCSANESVTSAEISSPLHSSSRLVIDTKPVISQCIRKKDWQPPNRTAQQPIDQVLIASPPTPVSSNKPTSPQPDSLYDVPPENAQVVKRQQQQPSSPNKNRRPDAIYVVHSTASSTPSPSLSSQMNYENVYGSKADSRKSLSPTPSSASSDQQQQQQQQPMSPQKRKMMQHLEAYYYQQRAADAQRRSLTGGTMDAREYAYWKQMQAAANKDRAMLIYEEHNRQMLAQQQQQQHPQQQVYYGSLRKTHSEGPYAGAQHVIYQKPLRQPVLVVRPQQCSVQKGSPVQRSVSCSPGAGDYGTVGGTKRVSFSGQGSKQAQWPTKHGPAPEPPTRRNKVMESPVYNSSSPTLSQSSRNSEDYEGNKPLPPVPSTQQWALVKTPPPPPAKETKEECKLQPTFSESESGSEAGEVQRIMQQRQNGGTGKGEVEGPNDHAGRRIVGSVGVGVGGGGVAGPRSGGVGAAGRSRDEPRRHTLSGDHQPSAAALLHHQQFTNAVAVAHNAAQGGGGAPPGVGQPIHPLHPRHLPPPHSQYGLSARHTTMDLEMGTKSRQRKSPLPRGYPPNMAHGNLFDDDPGIMSEVETSSTGFRRGGKQRSSLPVVRTPSKTLERPLGLVFLQYRNETKRALLPNEITSIDTVKALFVRSFPKQLTMEYLDSPHVKIYIHDSNKDMFYELEDLRSHLRDIRDRSVLRLFESDGVAGMPASLGVAGGPMMPSHWEDQSYFSEPEFDSEFQHQHIHKSKSAKSGSSSYYMSGSSTLPRGGALLRPYSPATGVLPGPNATTGPPKALGTPGAGGGAPPAKPLRNYHCKAPPLGSLGSSRSYSRDSSVSLYSIPDRLHGESGYMSSPERGGPGGVVPVGGSAASNGPGGPPAAGRYPPGPYSAGSSYEDPYYSQYSGTVTPVIDEEARIRVEHMERQLANLTGLVQKALTQAPHPSPSPRDYLQVPSYSRSADKSVSFEKSVSFSDEPPDMNSPKQHSPQHTERDSRHNKPTPPPKPTALAPGQYCRDLALTPEMYNQLRGLQKKAKDLRQEIRNLRRMSQAQAHTVRETIRDTFITIRAMLMSSGDNAWASGDAEKIRLSREEDLYKQEMLWLEKDLTGLESTVEELRGNVINRKTRVNMSDVENMALILSKASKTVADLKVRFPNLQEGMKGLLSSEMEKVMREEKFLKEEPDRLESALKRCKKLTGTLVTLKRLASVQEQRLPNSGSVDAEEAPPTTPTSAQHSKAPVPAERSVVGAALVPGGSRESAEPPPHGTGGHSQRPENALDALLDELQTFSRPASQLSHVSATGPPPHLSELGRSASGAQLIVNRAPNMAEIGRKGSVDSSCLLPPGQPGTLRRLHSYPSGSDTDTSPPLKDDSVPPLNNGQEHPSVPPKPPVPERNAELLQLASARRMPPPPPPRTSSRSPLASPTSPQLPPRNPAVQAAIRNRVAAQPPLVKAFSESNSNNNHKLPAIETPASNSSSCESVNSQEGLQTKKERQEQLEQRHQELLRKQKALQEQYARLQLLQRNASGGTASAPPVHPPDLLLKKTGSESNLLAKMGLGLATTTSGSLSNIGNGGKAVVATSQTLPRNSTVSVLQSALPADGVAQNNNSGGSTTTAKVYETDIL